MDTSRLLPARSATPRLAAVVVAVLLTAASVVGAGGLRDIINLGSEPFHYDIAAWELENLPGRWLYLAGEPFRADRTPAQQDDELRRFFALTASIGRLERAVSDTAQRGQPPDAALIADLAAQRRERDRLENRVEATIEARLTSVIQREGLTRSLLGLPAFVLPPVDFELTDSPRSLVLSRRDRIELLDAYLLRTDLSLAEVEAIEAERLARDDLAAVGFETGGVGAYPTIVAYSTSYRAILERVAHEWLHNYLFFRPLGFNYYDSNALRTINETVASLAGDELAAAVLARWPLDEPPSRPTVERRPPSLDAGAELRQLRGEVEVMLAAGQIEAAEALMEQRRRELADRGYYIRKLNQAYFAFTNLYAGRAGSAGATNPIGPKVDELRRRSGSLREFLSVVGGITSESELDRALAALE